jgi:SAM-dependent methyltransferase
MSPESPDWNQRYQQADTPWDTGNPSTELLRILEERAIHPCRTLELGCGTGSNAIALAGCGFEVVAADISELAIERACERAAQAELSIKFLVADVTDLPDLGPPFPFVFDRGVYHVIRSVNLPGFLNTLSRYTQTGSTYLTLAGNANEVAEEPGPPRVQASEICQELSPLFDLIQLREFRFDEVVINQQPRRPLGWSALWRRT